MTSRVALITGGARGLGRVMALTLVDAGHSVILSATDTEAMAGVIAERPDGHDRMRAIPADLGAPGEAERLAEKAQAAFGRVDMLVNNAGLATTTIAPDLLTNPYRFWRSDRATIERFFAVNSVAPMLLSNLLAPGMIERGWGRIIANTTSLDSMLRMTLYAGSKAALEAETAVMANDLAGTGITANVLIPGGATGTRMTDATGIPRDQVFPDTIMGPPITFLASEASNHFTARRVLARRWRAELDPADAAMDASDPIAWTGVGALGVHPEIAMKK